MPAGRGLSRDIWRSVRRKWRIGAAIAAGGQGRATAGRARPPVAASAAHLLGQRLLATARASPASLPTAVRLIALHLSYAFL